MQLGPNTTTPRGGAGRVTIDRRVSVGEMQSGWANVGRGGPSAVSVGVTPGACRTARSPAVVVLDIVLVVRLGFALGQLVVGRFEEQALVVVERAPLARGEGEFA